jgi:hypothetical protein
VPSSSTGFVGKIALRKFREKLIRHLRILACGQNVTASRTDHGIPVATDSQLSELEMTHSVHNSAD